jgi:CelD/BcsL family acetyltransferase involved in cellulose biosynthesis
MSRSAVLDGRAARVDGGVSNRVMRPFEIKRITEASAWQVIATEWDRVLRSTPGHTGLQSFDFLATWWQHMAGNRKLWILAFYDSAELAGIAPFQMTERRILGKAFRTLEFVGMTEDILVPTVLFPESRSAELRAALVDYLAEHRAEWDLIELDELAAADPLLEALSGLSKRSGLIHRERPFHDCPFIDLSKETPESFFGKRSRKLLKNVRAAERKLGELGAVRVTTHVAEPDIDAGFDEFLRIEKLSWKRKAEVGMASDAAYAAFYRGLLAVFARGHGARVLILDVGGQPIAGTIAIVFHGIYCSLQIVHDEAYARFSPGTLLEYHELDGLLSSRSAQRYEFLGGALTNKLRWTSDSVATTCVRARAVEARTQLLDLYEFHAKPVAKRVLRRVGIFKPLGPSRPGESRPLA